MVLKSIFGHVVSRVIIQEGNICLRMHFVIHFLFNLLISSDILSHFDENKEIIHPASFPC